jgi:sugar/nucleoside kinase (ribokinase family)
MVGTTRIAFVGHLSMDTNVVGGTPYEQLGGGVYYGGVAARRMGAEVTVHTRCAPDDRERYAAFAEPGLEVRFLSGERSTSIRNDYPTDNPDDRVTRMLTRAEPFGAEDLPGIEGDIVHINPVWFGEFPAELIPLMRYQAEVLAGDAQGFLRCVLDDGSTEYRDWPDKERYLPLFDVFKVDVIEARVLTGLDDHEAAARRIRSWGPSTVLLTHRDGLLVLEGDRRYDAPFGEYTIEGRTGRGDTCTAAFLVARRRGTVASATHLAAAVTTRKMQYGGAYRG